MKNLSKKLTFKYTDEEKDIITFSSEGEWNSLLETFDGKSVLKITLEIRKEKKNHSKCRFFHERSEWKKK